MYDLIDVWKKPRMVISILLTALFYAALTIPFKGLIIIPNVSEIRPSAFVPVLASFIFGPAGAWGAAFGNLLGDLFGTLSYASIFGFIANLFLGYMPYKLWYHLFRQDTKQIEIDSHSKTDMKNAILSGLIANLFCAIVVAGGVFWVSGKSYVELWLVVMINNSLSLILLWPCLKLIIPFSQRFELNWFYQLRKSARPVSTPTQQLSVMVAIVFLISGTLITGALGYWETTLYLGNPWYEFSHKAIFWSALIHSSISGLFVLLE